MDYTEMEAMLEEMMQDPMYQTVFWIAMAVTLAVMLAIYVVTYILQGIGLRRLSMTAGLRHPAFAFVPILRWVQLGKMAELRLPQDRARRKPFVYSVHLPILMVLNSLLNVVCSVYLSVYLFITPDAVPSDRLARLMNGVTTAYNVINLIAVVMLLMALHRVFTAIGISSPMVLTILCGLISFCLPIFLFVYRNNAVVSRPMAGTGDGNNNDNDSGFYYDNK